MLIYEDIFIIHVLVCVKCVWKCASNVCVKFSRTERRTRWRTATTRINTGFTVKCAPVRQISRFFSLYIYIYIFFYIPYIKLSSQYYFLYIFISTDAQPSNSKGFKRSWGCSSLLVNQFHAHFLSHLTVNLW